jgi:hypothetical protein
MGWVKLDDNFFRHPKALAAGADGRFLAIAALCWSGAYLTDGHVPCHALPTLAFDAGMSIDEAQIAADRLVEVRLWVREPDGWRVHGWSDYQATRDERERQAALTRERQRRHREKAAPAKRVTKKSRVTDASVTRPEVEVEVEVEVEKRPTSPVHRTTSSSSVRGAGDDDDDRVREITDEIGRRNHARALAAGKVNDNPRRHLATCQANALIEHGADVASALERGAVADAITNELAPQTTLSRAAAARARRNGAA